MSRNYKNYGSKINSGNDTNISNSSNTNNTNQIMDNSVTKNNTKIISKDKNAKKKIEKEIPDPLYEHCGLLSKKFTDQRSSYNRINVEKLCESGKEISMVAYV